MEYLRLFDTENNYISNENYLPYPCISYVEEINNVYYSKEYNKVSLSFVANEQILSGLSYTLLPIHVDDISNIKSLKIGVYDKEEKEIIAKFNQVEEKHYEITEDSYTNKLFTKLILNKPFDKENYTAIMFVSINDESEVLPLNEYLIVNQNNPLEYTLMTEVSTAFQQLISLGAKYSICIISNSGLGGNYIESIDDIIETKIITLGYNDKEPKLINIDKENIILSNSFAIQYDIATVGIVICDYCRLGKLKVEMEFFEIDDSLAFGGFVNSPIFKGWAWSEMKYNGDKYNATSIPNYGFASAGINSEFKISDKITSIGDYAFYQCISLPIFDDIQYADTCLVRATNNAQSTYNIKEGTKWIDSSAFNYCNNLTSITIPNSVTSIGDMAFSNCSSLTSIEIPDSVTSIGDNAFFGCNSLTSVTIPDSVTSIGNRAFYNCNNFNNNLPNEEIYLGKCYYKYNKTMLDNAHVVINNGTTQICSDAFYDCYSLTSIEIPNSVTEIGDMAFNNCSSLTSIEIPNSVTEIGVNVFSNCSSLTSVTIGNSVTSIGNSAFRDCSGLTSIEIPNSVTSIDSYAFSNCTSLPIIDNIRYADTYLVEAVDKTLTTYNIKEGTKWIGNYAFSGCTNLTSIEIPNSVTEIGNSAFLNCSGLTSVTIGNSVTSIGGNAFNSCSGLTSIVIPNSVTSIGNYAFSYCHNIKDITLSENLYSISLNSFNFNNLDSIIVNENNKLYDSRENCNCLIDTMTNSLLKGCKNSFIPNTINLIYGGAFENCKSLTSITIPNSVTSIGDASFHNCSGLTSIEIPNSVTEIGSSTFWGCSGLTSVTIGNSVTSIGSSAFYVCSNLTSITCYTTTAPTVDSYAFYGIALNGTLYYPSGSDYSSWISALPSTWTTQEIDV